MAAGWLSPLWEWVSTHFLYYCLQEPGEEMLIKPFSARALWTVAAFAVVYFYIAFTVQFPPGYWDPFTAVPVKPAPLPDCVLEAFTKGAPKPISIYPEKRLGELDGWDINPFVGSGWSNSPETEDYGALLTNADRRLLGELTSSTGASDPKSARINTFYNLDTEEDWENYINELDDGGLAPLTKFAQKYLHAHQHPTTCTDKKFLIFKKYPNDESFGLGAVVQSISTQLAIAIRDNRILIYDALEPPGMHFFQSPPPASSSNHTTACGQSLDCIFHKLTNCTHAAAAQAADVVHFPWNEQTPESAYKIHPNSLPVALGRALTTRFPDMIPDARKYWWRGQVAAYVMRPNGAAMQRLKELRMAPELHQGSQRTGGGTGPGAAAEELELEMPFPLPEGAFSMHVRHGDKGIEMNLVPFRDYIARAEEHILKNPMSARRIAFLSTEDPGVIAEAKNISSLFAFSKDRSWEWYWSKIPRSNVGPETQLQQFGNRTEMTIKWLLQLTMALECETFVGTRGSGWNRLIDQLRCTWHSNCKSPYLEVGDDKSWAHYGF